MDVQGTPSPHASASGMKGFLTKDMGGMPTWVWVLVVGAGLASAYIIPKFMNKKPAGDPTTTGTDSTSGIGLAVDPTTGLPYAVEGLVPAGGTVGTMPPPAPTPNPGSSSWPTSLNGMKVWQGTQSHNFWFGPNGPQPGQAGQTLLSSLFPTGTTFSTDNNGKAGSHLFYTLPGTTTPVEAPITLVYPLPGNARTPAGNRGPSPTPIAVPWPGNTEQVRMY